MKAEEKPGPKIGAGHAEAMFRQGLRELRGAMFPESNVAQQPEYGIWGTKTPGEVAESRRAAELDREPRSEPPAEPQRDLEMDQGERRGPELDRD